MVMAQMIRKREVGPMWVDLALVLAVLGTRMLTASHYLHKWDSVQFALALSDYDIARHQPHPPGYPGYVGLAWLARLFVPDDNTALVCVGVISAAVLVVAVHRLGRMLWGPRAGFAAGVLATLNPLLWYFSSVALSYTAGAAVATVAALVALRACGRGKWGIPLLAGTASLFWPYSGILVLPVCLWGFFRREGGNAGETSALPDELPEAPLGTLWLGFVAVFALPLLVGYMPVVIDAGGWSAYFHAIQSESGKHILRFGQWAQNPLMELMATTGSLADFFKQGLGIGRWLLLMLLIPITGEIGCQPRRVVGLLPLGIAGFVVMHWGENPMLRTAGILACAFTIAHLLPTPTTADGRIARRFLTWWLAPGLLLFLIVYVNYVGILVFFLPGLILLIAWVIDRAAHFMYLQTIRDHARSSGEEKEGEEEVRAPVRKSPDVKVERLVAWLLIVLMAMHEVGVFVDYTEITPETPPGSLPTENRQAIGIVDSWVEGVVSAVEEAPVEGKDLVVLGGVYDYRHLTYYLPEARVIWTKYLLYFPVRRDRGIWVSRNYRQEMVAPEIVEGEPLEARLSLEGAKGLIVFPDELALFAGSAVVTILGGEVEEGEEPLCCFIPVGEATALFFGDGLWWLE